MFGPLGPLRMWPEETPDDLFWQRFHDEQLYRGMRREDIPPRMREQIPIEVDPPDKPWWMPGRRLISGLP